MSPSVPIGLENGYERRRLSSQSLGARFSPDCPGRIRMQSLHRSSLPEDDVFISMAQERIKIRKKRRKGDMLIMVLSAMYAKLLIVMGIAFPLSWVISPHLPGVYYTGFYIYLYLGSIVFLVYGFTVHARFAPFSFRDLLRKLSFSKVPLVNNTQNNNVEDTLSEKSTNYGVAVDSRNCGSFYLRVGAVAFGIGSMIYSGLEFIQYLELQPACLEVLQALSPCLQMVFTFAQLYFLFINSKMTFHHHEAVGRFGLMHIVATNLCIWLLAVVEESQHEILHMSETMGNVKAVFDPDGLGNKTAEELQMEYDDYFANGPGGHGEEDPAPRYVQPTFDPWTYAQAMAAQAAAHAAASGANQPHHRVARAAVLQIDDQCRRTDVFMQLVQDISPFLFPCIIEYSLICAAISYIMWKQVGKRRIRHPSDSVMDLPVRRHQYSVDCSHAIKGLFTGILVLVLSIISVILFFVLMNRKEYQTLAIKEAYISEMILFFLTTVAVFVAMIQIRGFRYNHQRNVELDNILLIVAQIGVYMFSIFSIIAGNLAQPVLLNHYVVASSIGRLVQATVQTIFILDATQRNANNVDDAQRKPGREMVTFLMVTNFAMWIITTLETGRSDSNMIQIGFYGFWGWTIIARISTPLAIFYRFHSTVCLCDIWKKLYKVKAEQM